MTSSSKSAVNFFFFFYRAVKFYPRVSQLFRFQLGVPTLDFPLVSLAEGWVETDTQAGLTSQKKTLRSKDFQVTAGKKILMPIWFSFLQSCWKMHWLWCFTCRKVLTSDVLKIWSQNTGPLFHCIFFSQKRSKLIMC